MKTTLNIIYAIVLTLAVLNAVLIVAVVESSLIAGYLTVLVWVTCAILAPLGYLIEYKTTKVGV